ncbi:MAG: hypothetical protein AAF614_32515 [Chloroflexota bacterium]
MAIQVTREMLLGKYIWGASDDSLAVSVVGHNLMARKGSEMAGAMMQRTIAHFAYDGDAIRAESEMDRRFFNRREGEEVVEMLQMVSDHFDYATVNQVQHGESLITNELPGRTRGTVKVFEWLVAHLA